MSSACSKDPNDTLYAVTVNDHSVDGDELKNPTTAHSSIKLTDQTNLLPHRKVQVVFAGLALCVLVSTLDSVIAATTRPSICAYFHAGSIASWAPNAYMLTSTSFQTSYGRFSDIFGRKAVVCTAMLLFMIGCLLSGFSRNFVELIIWRGVTGVGGSGILSLAQIIISDVVSLRERGKYEGIISLVIAIGCAIGCPVGGALAEKVTWRWCFWVNLPLSFTALCVVLFLLPLKPVGGNVKQKLVAIDYIGVGLSLGGSALLLLPLIWGGVTFPWKSAIILAPLCAGGLVVILFCFWEWKGAVLPIVPMYIFRHVTVIGVYIAMFVNGFVFFSSLCYLPPFFEVALGHSPIWSGVFMVPVLVGQSFSSWITGLVVSRTGRYRMVVYIGFSLWALACGCLSTVKESTPRGFLVFYLLLAGFGCGQTMQTTTVAAQASVPRKDMSVVTAIKTFARQLGGTLSPAVGSTLLNNSIQETLTSLDLSPSAIKTIVNNPGLLSPRTSPAKLVSVGLTPAQATYALTHGYVEGFKWVFMLNAIMASVGAITCILMIKHKELNRGDEDKLREEAKRLLESRKEETNASMDKGEQNVNTVKKDLADVEKGN